jgi:hypothetical protein
VSLRPVEGTHKPDITGTVERAVGRNVSEITYGEKLLASMGEEFSSWNLEAVELINTAGSTFWFVDVFHFCMFVYSQVLDAWTYHLTVRFVPSWFPGAAFR